MNVNVTQGLTASGVVVATFADANTSDTSAQFTATIDWGDGSSSTGTVTGSDGLFTVTANQTYADPGHDNLTVTILDSAGPTATVNPTAIIGSADERLIGELYRILLGREADSAGFAYWDNLMSGGTTEAQVIQGFEASLEFKIDMGNELYERYLQRTMDAASVTLPSVELIAIDVDEIIELHSRLGVHSRRAVGGFRDSDRALAGGLVFDENLELTELLGHHGDSLAVRRLDEKAGQAEEASRGARPRYGNDPHGASMR